MHRLDDVVGSAVPSGDLSKPLIIALFALLASDALYKRSGSVAAAVDEGATSTQKNYEGVREGLNALLRQFEKANQ